MERIRAQVCPDASFQATLIACAKRVPTPVVHVEVKLGYKKDEERQLRSRQMSMFSFAKPEPKLRVQRATPNEPAKRSGLIVHQNMRVPESSVIAVHFRETDGLEISAGAAGTESLSIWEHSDGKTLGSGEIQVEVRRFAGSVQALIQRRR